jgi:diguanylate cyclase (GGDEF)-like protein
MNILRFYKLIEQKKRLFMNLSLDELYRMIIEIASKSIDAEISSLMMIEDSSPDLIIKAEIGLPPEVVSSTRMKVGEGISGYVAMTGEALLVKDIKRDPRFRDKALFSDRYYTDSLISAPLVIGGKVVGVINMNNERTRRLFNEEDLALLKIIAEHASLAIEASSAYHEKLRQDWLHHKTLAQQKEDLRAETERLKAQMDRLKREVRDASRWKGEVERLQREAKEVEDLKREVEWLRKRAATTREVVEAEALKARAASLQIEIEDREKEKKEDFFRRQASTLKLQVEELRAHEEELLSRIREAERLLSQAKVVNGLKEEADALREQIQRMRDEERALRTKIQDVEGLRKRAEEAKGLKAKTEELSTLYEISKEIVSIKTTSEILPWILEKVRPLVKYRVASYILEEKGEVFGEIVAWCEVDEGFVKRFKESLVNSWRDVGPKGGEGIEIGLRCPGLKKEPLLWDEDEWISSPILDRGRITGLLYVGKGMDGEFKELAKRIIPIAASHASVAIEKIRVFEETKERAEHDELTGLYNFRYFGESLPREFRRARRYNQPLSITAMDLDYLKAFNDTYGHLEGNRLIKEVSRLVLMNTREVDIVVRFGGDEFIILSPQTSSEDAKAMAQRILHQIRAYRYKVKGHPYKISVSIGIASLPEVEAKRPMEFFMRADEALYRAKHLGRDRIFVYGANREVVSV